MCAPQRPPRNTAAGWPNAASSWLRCCAPIASARPDSNTGACENSPGKTDDASIISAAGLRIAETTAAYIDQVSEELVAEEALGHPLDEHRLQVELALLASQWLGATVLRQPGAARR